MKRRFLLKLTAFLLPFGVYFSVTVGSALYVGEFIPVRDVIRLQMGSEPVLYGRAYWDDQFAFKLLAVKARKPEVIVIGSSRAMQFRANLLTENPAAFFNAGGAARSLDELAAFLNALDESEIPAVMIVGLDQHWFNPQFHRELWAGVSRLDENGGGFSFDRALDTSWETAQDLLTGKIRLDVVLTRQEPVYGAAALGFAAVMTGRGFRNDGSFQANSSLPPEPFDPAGLEDLQRYNPHMLPGQRMDEARVQQLEDFLARCQSRHIVLIGFAPPFAPSLYEAMTASGQYDYMVEESGRLKSLFAAYGFAYYDFTDIRSLGTTDQDMLDYYHGSEYIALRIYTHMLEQQPEVLGRYSRLEDLRAFVTQSDSPFNVFGNAF